MKKIDIACIIDDDPIFIFGAKRMMKLANFCNSFMVFHNGKKALESLKSMMFSGQNLPGIILLDLNMPVMDGWQFLDEFTKIPASETVRLFIITSSIDIEDIKRAQAYEVVSNYIVKPITIEKLNEILENVE